MGRQIITTHLAPRPTGPYSQGIRAGSFVFVAGEGPYDPKTQEITGTDIKSQTLRTLGNIKAIIEAADLTLKDVVKVSVFLKNKEDFAKMDEVYKTFFPENPPVRTTVQAGFFAPAMLIKTDAIAYRE